MAQVLLHASDAAETSLLNDGDGQCREAQIVGRMEEQWQKTIERSCHEDEAARVEQERRLAKERELAAQMRYAEELKVHQLAGPPASWLKNLMINS